MSRDPHKSIEPLGRAETERLLAPLASLPRLALAVSGGPDSLALLHLLSGWCRAHTRLAPTVLTVDHDLRPGSHNEAELVARIAELHGLPHAILTWRHGSVDAGVQARARSARYDLMAAYCTAHNIPTLVTAHHLDDQAETFLMRLQRGSGLDGLAAIPAQGSWAGLMLLRPLLDVPKARLVATAEAAELPFVSDPSNDDTRYERGRLRGAMQALAQLGFTPEAIARSARRLRRARAALDAAAKDFLTRHAETSAAGYASLAIEDLLTLPEEIGLRALDRLVATVGGALEPVRLAKLEALYAALPEDPGKGHTLGGCQIVPSGGRLALFREVRSPGLPESELRPGQRMLWDNRFRIELSSGAPAPVMVRALGEEGLRELGRREGQDLGVPRQAARALPACWQGDVLLGLPDFGQGVSGHGAPLSRHEGRIDCLATFLWTAA